MIISRAVGWTDEYWSNDFDPDKDCAQEEKIAKLKNQVKLPSSRGWTHFILEMLLYFFLKNCSKMFDYMDKGQDYLSQCEREQVSFPLIHIHPKSW